ncbi:MAG TPA: hypothetical protein DD670_09980, partial [Planctomycetaceae bacterium]|nr:hypothetical protein [Planctomycetaceae bacterium]
DGTFAARVDYTVGSGPQCVTAADVDGDGWVDLVAANYGSNTVSVLRNQGDGTFAARVDFSVGGCPMSVTAADVDGDGRVDLVAANFNSHTISVLRNQGDGTFAARVDYAVGGAPRSVMSADVDGDGRVDLVTANSGFNTVSVLWNLGDGMLAARVDFLVGSVPTSVTAADVDGDGRVDLVTTNAESNTISVLRNLGSPSPSRLPGDANNDGVINQFDAKILASNWGKSNMTWADGDFNNDGMVNAIDAAILAAHFGMTLPPPGEAMPSEPLSPVVTPVEVVADVSPFIGPLPVGSVSSARQPIQPVSRAERASPMLMGALVDEATPRQAAAACDAALVAQYGAGQDDPPTLERQRLVWFHALVRRRSGEREDRGVFGNTALAVDLLLAE